MTMHPSLRGIANKARGEKQYRFRHLYTMLNVDWLRSCWNGLNKKAAAGVDRVTAREYGKNLSENLRDLVERLKRKSYRAKLVRRRRIPKGNGKLRPLGIPVLEDKLVQLGVTRILEAIYESDFLPCSYGYRPRRGALDALKDLSRELQFGRYRWVVDADIRSFFDVIVHEHLVSFLERRVDDKAFLRLIGKWLRAGVLEEWGEVIHPETGCPQGGIVSPMLANIYLHYVLDEWFEHEVKPRLSGQALLIRYADDFVCAFEFRDDADRFYKALRGRLGRYGLSLSEEKTRLVKFDRYEREDSESFEFLGFELRCGLNRQGKPQVVRRTARRRLRSALSRVTEWCRRNRHRGTRWLVQRFNRGLVGHYQYYGVIGNHDSLKQFFHLAKRILWKWLNRRSQRRSYTWKRFDALLRRQRVATPRITEHRQQQRLLPFSC